MSTRSSRSRSRLVKKQGARRPPPCAVVSGDALPTRSRLARPPVQPLPVQPSAEGSKAALRPRWKLASAPLFIKRFSSPTPSAVASRSASAAEILSSTWEPSREASATTCRPTACMRAHSARRRRSCGDASTAAQQSPRQPEPEPSESASCTRTRSAAGTGPELSFGWVAVSSAGSTSATGIVVGALKKTLMLGGGVTGRSTVTGRCAFDGDRPRRCVAGPGGGGDAGRVAARSVAAPSHSIVGRPNVWSVLSTSSAQKCFLFGMHVHRWAFLRRVEATAPTCRFVGSLASARELQLCTSGRGSDPTAR